MQQHNHEFKVHTWASKLAVLILIAGSLTACNNKENPDVVVVSPTAPPSPVATTPVSPAVVPTPTASSTTTTVVVSPTPRTSSTTTSSPGSTTTTTTTVIKEPITDVVVITSAPDQQTLLNRRVEFTNVKGQDVNGDRTFWVGTSNTQRLFVVLDPALDKGKAEQAVQIKDGQTLDLTGVLKPIPSADLAQKQWGLSAAEAKQIRTQKLYLQTDKINFKK